MPKHAIYWFEIPTQDIHGAVRFYNRVLNLEMAAADMLGNRVGLHSMK